MKRLAQAIAERIREYVKRHVEALQGDAAEFRAVFNGPPAEILGAVFEALVVDGGIEVTRTNGVVASIPVVLQVDRWPEGNKNPPIGQSGTCNKEYLLDLRNSTHCLIFVGLVPPGQQSNLSQTTTRSDFGVAARSNLATASISDWWNDKFIQNLVDGALARYQWPHTDGRDEAKKLVEHAVYSADEVDKHDVARHGAWLVLSRLWSISFTDIAFPTQVSLACGYPPFEDNSIDAGEQVRVLKSLSTRLEDGFRPGIQQVVAKADNDEERAFLGEVLAHLQHTCEVPIAFGRSTPHYYGPFSHAAIDHPPGWWAYLTVERWVRLLEEDDKRKGAIQIECTNSIVSQTRGFIPVVASKVGLRIALPESVTDRTEVVVTRDVAGAGNHREWTLSIDGVAEIEDDVLPTHKAPARYAAYARDAEQGKGLKKGACRIISLATWEPGIIVCARTASKSSFPKQPRSGRDDIAYEVNMALNGQGRHYLDVYVRSGVRLEESAEGSDESGVIADERRSAIAQASEQEYGFEAEATSENYYDLTILKARADDEDEVAEKVRIYLSGDEVTAEECGSEFERLIRLNRQRDGGRATTEVQVNRQLRSSDLQGWMLSADKAAHSFYPLVLGQDYASDWRTRDWRSRSDTILSQGRFLNDPRPSPEEMTPPEAFIGFRIAIAAKIRGADGNGLIEAARLGEWLAADLAFGELVEGYVRTYEEWLKSSPDSAAWCDVSIVTRFESDGTTLVQEPDAILVSPLHPIRFAWHCLAQRALFLAQRKLPCPAASILDPDCVPDAIALPLRTAAGGVKGRVFFSVECSSDYWGILWNARNLGRLASVASEAPFDKEFGILVGGVSSGFSVSQVHRALDDISEMRAAKPVLNILLSSAAGQNNSCNEGLLSWCRKHLAEQDEDRPMLRSLGPRLVQILDERKPSARPEDADISNLAEDTGNAVRWYGRVDRDAKPDLGIIAQLETSNADHDEMKIGSPLSIGGLIRNRIRQQLKAAAGAFLSETRTGLALRPSGDGLADRTMSTIARLENLSDKRFGYVFAPSVHAIQTVLEKAEFAAVSSSAVDPACFLGGWLERTYLWDYDLPSYSSRAGDSNGYYLLSQIKELDRETLELVLSRLPGCKELPAEKMEQVILEVARRGIPTVRGLSSGDSGASGDLGLFVASRLLQDEFGTVHGGPSMFPVWVETEIGTTIVLVVPVDPFKGYLEDLTRAIKKASNQRPDLVVVAIEISDSRVACKLTPVEVKYRSAKVPMSNAACKDALQQAKSLSALFEELSARSDEQEMVLWKLAFQHLLVSMLGFGFRVYSQQTVVSNRAVRWSEHHARVIEALFAEEIDLEIDRAGRLIVIDGSPQSSPRDFDEDGFMEAIVLGHSDAALIVKGEGRVVYDAIRDRVKDWRLLPNGGQTNLSFESHRPSTGGSGVEASDNPETNDGKSSVIDQTSDVSNQTSSVESNRPADASDLSEGQKEGDGLVTKADEVVEVSTVGSGIDLLIGNTIDGFREEVRRLNLSDTNLNQLNIGVVGDLGTGKTQFLKSLIYQVSKSAAANQGVKPRFLIFDYKKDYSSEDFVKATGARIVKPQHLPLNLFDISESGDSMAPWLGRFKFFSDVLDKIYSGVGPVQRATLKKAVRQAYEQLEGTGLAPTIYDIHSNYQSLMNGRADSISAIIDDIVDMEMFSPVRGDVVPFEKFLDGTVVISLDALGSDDRTKNMLVAVMLNMFYEHMLRIPKRPYVGTDPNLRVIDSYLLVDEADNIMQYEFDVLRKVLLQGREFGVGVILASQFLRHFKVGATDYREPLLSWFIHKVPNVTPQELGALGLTGNVTQQAEKVKSLALHQCLFKTYNVAGEFVRGIPFYEIVKEEP